MRTLRIELCTLEPQVEAHAAEMFPVLSDPAIYEFENAPPTSEGWLAERYARLEARVSKDGSQRWLNWVVRLDGGELCGYVQATVLQDQSSYVAYEFASKFWCRGIGSCAVRAILEELASQYAVHTAVAVLKARNHRSLALLRRLAFSPGSPEQFIVYGAEQDELVMVKVVGQSENSG